jgi:hypothetical protein
MIIDDLRSLINSTSESCDDEAVSFVSVPTGQKAQYWGYTSIANLLYNPFIS